LSIGVPAREIAEVDAIQLRVVHGYLAGKRKEGEVFAQ